ncbi:MAG TPA: DUF1223 domain-containing protein [Tepidisphaeraceae bacterium]|jgi:hypothetical protein|nr:DUF1223 domain-containing protein [Tepidisphaeraceae bacterium]
MKFFLFGLMALSQFAYAGPATRPVVVELFTSEGCSSCPPADALVGKLVKDDPRVLALEFHVDYWNRLGWVDPFSSAAYSDRQLAYSRVLGLGEVYTPQIIVNGTAQCIGSDQQAVEQAIVGARAGEVKVGGEITPGYVVNISVEGKVQGCVLNVAVVERGLITEVAHGENGGKTLQHENVVRWFKTVPVGTTKVAIEGLPASVKVERASVIVLVQRSGQGGIIGASEIAFPK